MPDRAYSSRPTDPNGLVLEAWGQGLMVGSLVVNKLIFAELVLAMPHGTFIFVQFPAYECLHNVIAWTKNKPFLSRRVSLFYISTVILVQPYWMVEIYANFAYFQNGNPVYQTTPPKEPLFRDPWWIFTTISLVWTIKRVYSFGIVELVIVAPRFGIILVSMCLSIIFMIVETCSVLHVFNAADLPTGIQPFWKLSFVFKCLCDTVILDDFKTALDQIRSHRFQRPIPTEEDSLRRHRSPRQAEMEDGFDLGPSPKVVPQREKPLPRVVLGEDAGTR